MHSTVELDSFIIIVPKIITEFKEFERRKKVEGSHLLEVSQVSHCKQACLRIKNSFTGQLAPLSSPDYFSQDAKGEFELIVFRPHCNRLVYRKPFPIPDFDSSTGSFTLVKLPMMTTWCRRRALMQMS